MSGEDDEYDHVTIVNPVDGTKISGTKAVREHFAKEAALLEEYGSSVYFQFFRLDFDASELESFQGPRLLTYEVDGSAIDGGYDVDDVTFLLREFERARLAGSPGSSHLFGRDDELFLFFNKRPMNPDALFFAEHFMLVPSWVQVFIHDRTSEHVMARLKELIMAPEPPAGAAFVVDSTEVWVAGPLPSGIRGVLRFFRWLMWLARG